MKDVNVSVHFNTLESLKKFSETSRYLHRDQIRTRAAHPDGFVKNTDGTPAANYVIGLYEDTWTDEALALKAVQFEERLEFAMEGHRRFDQVRCKIAAETLTLITWQKEQNEHTS